MSKTAKIIVTSHANVRRFKRLYPLFYFTARDSDISTIFTHSTYAYTCRICFRRQNHITVSWNYRNQCRCIWPFPSKKSCWSHAPEWYI